MSNLNKWLYRGRSMVRYRLLFLTSAPILLTLLALFAITAYWSVHYTWQSALVDVTERLHSANNTLTQIQDRKAATVENIANSFSFQNKLNQAESPQEIKQWLNTQKQSAQLDFLVWHPANSQTEQSFNKQTETYFQVLAPEQTAQLDQQLTTSAQVRHQEQDYIEQRSLVSRTQVPVFTSDSELLGYLDGGFLLNNNYPLVDQLRDTVYPLQQKSQQQGSVTLFLGDLRITTNVPTSAQLTDHRATGTLVSNEVKQAVLNEGKVWADKAYVYDQWYIAGYQPLTDKQDNIIGMLYTGYLISPLIKTYITNLGEVTVIVLLLLLVSGFIVYRGARDLFRPIEHIHRVVKLIQIGKDEQRIGDLGLSDKHELTQLAKQFDNMLNQLQYRNIQIQEAAHELESKVESRTASLKEKTEQLELHIQLLNQTQDKLITSEKLAALGELTAGIAHEINNPTAVILGNVELIRLELAQDAPRVEEEIDAILTQIDRIRNITRSLLQYSRQGGVQDQITWQHVNPIVEESVTLVRTGAKKRDIQFVKKLNASVSVEVNRHHLLQVLVNLQMNGIHAMQGKGTLRLETEDWIENDKTLGAMIHVVDEGSGISESNLKRIFDPFFTTKREGTGLGLSVSQSILSETGGEIKVESTLGQGSRFTLYLPVKAEQHTIISQVG
ncbi:sensor histidine kinase [Vibrio hippocampi]|uniref:histidine kinase n=1 Tax=Vibrio hippocampi TaxID=654686 RepID=A0ABM8ZIB2_9VIBR|nr:cache domain-containing protein [Vibrio hippocampi]CAH0525955.1 Adaptive-response sensory-kinase SasA [Vibrio hippocampi]